jgi:hypothetical protein
LRALGLRRRTEELIDDMPALLKGHLPAFI